MLCDEAGVLTLVWDNTYSLITSREVNLRIAVKRRFEVVLMRLDPKSNLQATTSTESEKVETIGAVPEDTVKKMTSEAAPASVTESVSEPVSESVTEPVSEPVTGPVTEPVSESATESVTETPEQPTQQTSVELPKEESTVSESDPTEHSSNLPSSKKED